MRRSLTNFARKFEGNIPYKYGGKNPATTIDCSGFTQFVYSLFDMIHSMNVRVMSASMQYNYYKGLGCEIDRPYEGVLVFYHKPKSWHVMICLDPYTCIGASGENVVVRDIDYRDDRLGYMDPFKQFGDKI